MNPFVHHFASNTSGKDFIVGDIHGNHDQLMHALSIINFDFVVDRLFSVGDLIDRGTQNIKCLGLLDTPWFFSVQGNHEAMMAGSIDNYTCYKDWMCNGGQWHKTEGSEEEYAYWASRLKSLPGVITVGSGSDRFNVVHAEPEGRYDYDDMILAIDDQDIDCTAAPHLAQYDRSLLWGRSIIKGKCSVDLTGLSPTYVGHTSLKCVTYVGPIMYIDRGFFHHIEGTALAIACHTDKLVYEYNSSTKMCSTTKYVNIPIVKQAPQ